jgi:DNA-damage-inducible protein J
MLNNSIVRARINEQIKEEASVVLSEIGLTVSDAMRMLLIRIAREKALPFSPLIPNSTTIKAIEAARRGEFITTCTLDNLFNELNADD